MALLTNDIKKALISAGRSNWKFFSFKFFETFPAIIKSESICFTLVTRLTLFNRKKREKKKKKRKKKQKKNKKKEKKALILLFTYECENTFSIKQKRKDLCCVSFTRLVVFSTGHIRISRSSRATLQIWCFIDGTRSRQPRTSICIYTVAASESTSCSGGPPFPPTKFHFL